MIGGTERHWGLRSPLVQAAGGLSLLLPLTAPLAVLAYFAARRWRWSHWWLLAAGATLAVAGVAALGPWASVTGYARTAWDAATTQNPRAWATLALASVPSALLVAGAWRGWMLHAAAEGWRPKTKAREEAAQEAANRRRGRRTKPHQADQVDGLDLGTLVSGTLTAWEHRGRLVVPNSEVRRHIIALGETGTGKTVSLLRLAAEAIRAGWNVLYLDCKGDPSQQQDFAATMLAAGVAPDELALYPQQPYDLWRGAHAPGALTDRLMATQEWTESYYESTARMVLSLVTEAPAGPPASASAMLSRLNKPWLTTAWASDPARLAEVKSLQDQDLAGVARRFSPFLRAFRGTLDGHTAEGDAKPDAWAWEDPRAAYVLVPGLARPTDAAGLATAMLTDFANYAGERRAADARPTLLVVDEFSAISERVDLYNLVERVRYCGVGVVVSSQSVEGLGEERDARRLISTAGTLLLHRLGDPEALVALGGTVASAEVTQQVSADGATGTGSIRHARTFTLNPDRVRTLDTGCAALINGGRVGLVQVAMEPVPSGAADQAARLVSGSRPPARSLSEAAARLAASG